MFEPPLTGISYSFTDDGFYEEAYYRAVSNRKRNSGAVGSFILICATATDPSCPKGIIQWQHGKYQKNPNGSLSLLPFEVDGRQLLSDPCNYKNAIYTRYKQRELFKVNLSTEEKMIKAQQPNNSVDLLRRDRRLQQSFAPQPFRVRRGSFKPHVPRLQTAADAAHANAEPDCLIDRRPNQIHRESETRS